MIPGLPKHITLAGIDIEIVIDNEMTDEKGLILGRACYETQRIYLNDAAIPNDSVWQNYYHELMHWVFHTMYRHDLQVDEQLVDTIAHLIYQARKTAR